MHDVAAPEGAPPDRLRLGAVSRRVLGVLIEKSLATPDYYPMTLKALVAGSNQKNNRDPITALDDVEVESALSDLQARRLVLAVKESGSRSTKWRHELQRVYNLQGRELAVLAELLLRGAQAEGELRARAARMRPIDDLQSLHETLESLSTREPPFARRLSPEGQVRGVRHAHLLYEDDELEQVERLEAEVPLAPAPVAGRARDEELVALRERVVRLEARLSRIEGELGLPSEPRDE